MHISIIVLHQVEPCSPREGSFSALVAADKNKARKATRLAFRIVIVVMLLILVSSQALSYLEQCKQSSELAYIHLMNIGIYLERIDNSASVEQGGYSLSSLESECRQLDTVYNILSNRGFWGANPQHAFTQTLADNVRAVCQTADKKQKDACMSEYRRVIEDMLISLSDGNQLRYDEYGMLRMAVKPWMSYSQLEQVLTDGLAQLRQLAA